MLTAEEKMDSPLKSHLNSLHSVEPYELATPSRSIHRDALHMLGFEFDGTACFRKGANKGPNAIRRVSNDIESYSPYLDRDLTDLTFYDLGNLPVLNKNGEQSWEQATTDFLEIFDMDFRKENVRTLLLGGEHSVSYAPIKRYLSCYPNLVVLHLDAHADLRDGYQGFHYSHASIIKRIVDHFSSNHQLIQYGIRSGTKQEFQWMNNNGTNCSDQKEFLKRVHQIDQDRPIYLTLDLDYFDPAFLAGTGTPEPGGEDFHSFVSLIKILAGKNFVGADVVELAPEIDPTGNSEVFATTIVREIILAMENS